MDSSSTEKDLSSSSFSASAGISAGPSRHSPVSPCKPTELYLVTCYMHSKTFVLPVIFSKYSESSYEFWRLGKETFHPHIDSVVTFEGRGVPDKHVR